MNDININLVSQATSATFIFSITKLYFYYSLLPFSSPPLSTAPIFLSFSFSLWVTDCDASPDQKALPIPASPSKILAIFSNLADSTRVEGIMAGAHSLWEPMGTGKISAAALWSRFVSAKILNCWLIKSVVCGAYLCQIASLYSSRPTRYTSPYRCLPREVTPLPRQRW